MDRSLPSLFAFFCTFILQISTLMHALPIESNDLDPAALSDLEDLINQAVLTEDLPPGSAHDTRDNLHLPRPHFFGHAPPDTPTDTPTLKDLMRSALRSELIDVADVRKPMDFPEQAAQLLQQELDSEGEELSKREGKQLLKRVLEGGVSMRKRGGEASKRSFDSISRSSGFGGMHRGSFGGPRRENLTFTFESLFPAIARGLRSIN